ncbi:DUF3408 domain-containing protein [Agriterribacter sp.]|jgi:hypothetical protein|uniref:DUF3408 domain-containing protein n=1 Tax=Agriterribacter sp. TaxID=2821509 RepID=UPI002C795E72|nr:DUF3408 domain-containing protein [Agriterribacter sp.]HRO46774.1 DUF3408 domain-containing protein [Agriterribacter sp.]
MENEDKRKSNPAIDEDYLMSLMAGGEKQKQPSPEPSKEEIHAKPVAREKGRPKKGSEAAYEKLFFKNPGTNARNGKSVYIRPEFHERLSRIVQVIGEDRLTLYAYLDNVLEHHFQEFSEQITTSFNDKYKPIL